MFESTENQNNRFSQQAFLPINTEVSVTSLNVRAHITKPISTVAVKLPQQYEDDILEDTPSSQKSQLDPKEVFLNFINYVQFHSIQPCDIWEGRHYLPLLLFTDICDRKLGYKFSLCEIKMLKEMSEDSNLRKQHFAQVNLWRKTSICNYQTELYPHTSMNRLVEIKENRGSGVRLSQKNTQSRSSETFFKSRISKRKRTTADQITQNFLKSVYTNQRNKDHKLEALREDMEMNALEKKWEFIVMAGQMNKWIQEAFGKEESDSKPVFKIINKEANFTILWQKGDYSQIVPEVVFVKRYKAMKKKKTTKLDSKQIDKTIKGLTETSNSKAQVCKLSQRDKELNEVLLHIMRVRNTLESQYKVLTQAAINT